VRRDVILTNALMWALGLFAVAPLIWMLAVSVMRISRPR